MISIRSWSDMAKALDSPINANLKNLLTCRRDQLFEYPNHDFGEMALFIVVLPGDTIAELEAEAGHPIITSASFEWVALRGGWFEAITILSDDGFGIVLFAPEHGNVDPQLHAALRDHLASAAADGSSQPKGEGTAAA